MSRFKQLSFFWKAIIPVLIILPIGTLLNAQYLRRAAEESLVESSVLFGKTTIDQYKILRSYYTENVVKKVAGKGPLSVSFDHQGKENTIPLPATMIHDLSQKFSESASGLKLKLYSEYPFPHREDRKLDEFSKKALAYFKTNPDGMFNEFNKEPGNEFVRVAIADKMIAQSCVGCHNSHPQSPFKEWKVGDVRGVLEVQVPLQKQAGAIKAMVNSSGGFNLVTTILLVLVIAFVLYVFISKPVRHIIESLNQSVSETLTQSSTLASASTEVSEACSSQASAIQETASTLEEIRATSAKSVENAKISSDTSKASHRMALEGKDSVQDMIVAIKEIETNNQEVATYVDESNKRMGEIVHVINSIGAKTKVINDIVFQTKLLSFNASVEAARAGEHGKGFAVVAEEVGNLAQMSGNAAKEISDMLDDSIRKVQTIVDETKTKVEGAVRTGSGKVEVGNLTAKRCGELLDQVVSNVISTDEMMTEICEVAREQANGVSGIAEAMNQLENATQQNVDAAAKTSTISEELVTQSEALSALIGKFEAEALGKKSASRATETGSESAARPRKTKKAA